MYRHFLSLAVFILALIPIICLAQIEVPPLANRRIHDEAGAISQQTIAYLEQSLKVFEDSTSNQIAVLIVNSLDGESIDQFGIRVADQWKLGTKGNDNGVILLIAMGDRKMRIEVGQGLEGPLPDAICNRIIRNEMAPSFRRGDYDAGLIASVDAIRKAIKGEYKGTGPKRGRKGGSAAGFIVLLIILMIVMRGRGGRGGRGNGWSSGAGWYMGGMAAGSGFGGGGFSGGGFSGGGGGFGGGGSSGSW